MVAVVCELQQSEPSFCKEQNFKRQMACGKFAETQKRTCCLATKHRSSCDSMVRNRQERSQVKDAYSRVEMKRRIKFVRHSPTVVRTHQGLMERCAVLERRRGVKK